MALNYKGDGEFKAQEKKNKMARMVSYENQTRYLKQRSFNRRRRQAVYLVLWLAVVNSR